VTIKRRHPTRLNRREALTLLGAGAACGAGIVSGEQIGFAQVAAWLTARSATTTTFPKEAIIRTILEDVSPEALASGATMFHEHLGYAYSSPPPPPPPPARQGGAVAPSGQSGARPAPPETSIDLMVDEVRQAGSDGLSCIVDANSSGTARTDKQVEFLKHIAARAPNVHIVVAGGPFKAPYPAEIVRQSADELADQLVRDLTRQRWGAFGEIGTSMEMTADERKVLTAIAKAHVRTRLPIFTHTEHEGCAKCAMDQLDLFESQGADLKHLVIGHLADIKPGAESLGQTAKAIAKRGAFLGFDTVGHEMRASANPEAGKVRYVLEVLNAGYEDQLLLSADFSSSSQLKANWGSGFSTVLVQFIPKLKYAGVKDATLHKILVDNPRRFLSFVPKEVRR
jgi:phosphotriesterase-related protein